MKAKGIQAGTKNTPLKPISNSPTKTYQPIQSKSEKIAGTRAGFSPRGSTQLEGKNHFSSMTGGSGSGRDKHGAVSPKHQDLTKVHGVQPKVLSTSGTNNTTTTDGSTRAYKNGPMAGGDMAGGVSKASPKVKHTNNPGSGY